MSEDQVKKLYNSITNISEEIIEEAQTAKPRRKLPVWTGWAAAAACVCLVVVGVFVWKQPSESFADANADDSGITVSEDGVTIPPLNVTLSMPPDVDACWAYTFFIYQGRCYVSYERIYEDVDLIGEHLGTATGMLDVWTPKEGYVDFAGNIEGDFYSVKGYDPSFMLCMKQEDGSIHTFICNNGITLKTGYDLYEKRLHLTESYCAVQYETRASWYNSADEVYQLSDPKSETVTAFLQALNAAEFMPTADVPLEEGEGNIYDGKEIYHVYFLLDNGMTVELCLFEGGYVSFQGLLNVCVQIPGEQFDAMVALFSAPDAGAQPLKSPPVLTMVCGGQSVDALLGTYSWQYDNGDGTITAVEACGGNALSYLDLMTPVSRGESEHITLNFAVEPTAMSIRCWNVEYANDESSSEANDTTLTCEDGTVEIPTDGSYVYEVKAEWESGDAYYSFYIVN